ncbi:hypothetical protein RRG08_012866 [Elysia crispata]|uniref:Uncharacterized protein n=1 Tax=Elysia crispata TaxID=231223 RepID=A0AAE0Y8D0_9GAST|nr:hypothetical protein RRG08_012866 [Elysia crispata]
MVLPTPSAPLTHQHFRCYGQCVPAINAPYKFGNRLDQLSHYPHHASYCSQGHFKQPEVLSPLKSFYSCVPRISSKDGRVLAVNVNRWNGERWVAMLFEGGLFAVSFEQGQGQWNEPCVIQSG